MLSDTITKHNDDYTHQALSYYFFFILFLLINNIILYRLLVSVLKHYIVKYFMLCLINKYI